VVAVAAVLALLVGGSYGYLRYRLNQIKTSPCTSCSATTDNVPFNILVIGDDSRADNTPSENTAFGSTTTTAGAHSDTIKIVHVEPALDSASLLSIPRDSYVELSGLSASWLKQLGTRDEKINAALNDNVDTLVQTIQDSFGIPIQSWVLINFNGLVSAIQTVGGIDLRFKYPVRDDDDGKNYSGLSIPQSGCVKLNGAETLALSRSRHYEYEVRPGVWEPDQSSDLGRITRQNLVIEALLNKVRGSDDPLTINAFIGSVVRDVRIGGLSPSQLLTIALKYHGFSVSKLETATVPTTPAHSAAGSIEVVQEPLAREVVTAFLGKRPNPVLTPPLNADGSPEAPPMATTTMPVRSTNDSVASRASGRGAPVAATQAAVPPYDPKPC
jgi:LCP family protein required for cell wall assembly